MIVAGIQITTDYAPPPPRGKDNPIRKAMEAMPVNASFFADCTPQAIHGIAKLMRPKKFKTAKKANGTRVWRTE